MEKSTKIKKLNVGCGKKPLVGYINLDSIKVPQNPQKNNYVQGDLRDISEIFEGELFEEIIATHVIEHILPREASKFIRACWNLLEPEGLLIIETPNIANIAREILKEEDSGKLSPTILAGLYGEIEPKVMEDFHKQAFTESSLIRLVESLKFKVIKVEQGKRPWRDMKITFQKV